MFRLLFLLLAPFAQASPDEALRAAVLDLRGDFLGDGTGLGWKSLDFLGKEGTGVVLPAALFVGGAFTGSETARRTGLLTAEAVFATHLVTGLGKNAFGRRRPDGSGDDSLPSGHTSGAFAAAAVVADAYESPWVDVAAYGLASAVGFHRLYNDRHWASDVLGGAALGLLIGKGVSRFERAKGWQAGLYGGGAGLFYRRKF